METTNLTIENLMKTEWFEKQFDKDQQYYILQGLEENLNVSIYAKPEIPWQEMSKKKIELGIKNINCLSLTKKTKNN